MVVTAPRLSQSKLFAAESVVLFVVSSFWLAVLAICEQLGYENHFKDIDSKYKIMGFCLKLCE